MILQYIRKIRMTSWLHTVDNSKALLTFWYQRLPEV